MKLPAHLLAGLAALAFLGPARAVTLDSARQTPIQDLLRRMLARAAEEGKNDQAFKERYAYIRTKTTDELDNKGRVKKHEVKKSENIPAPAPEPTAVSLAVPSSAAGEAAPQDSTANIRQGKGRAFQKNDFPLTGDLLDRFEVTLAGRDVCDGRPLLVLDFKPASKKLPVRNFKDRFINKVAGRVWVDEAEAVVAKADLRLTEEVSVVGGLVGALKKFDYSFDRKRTPDGLWYTAGVHWRLEGREVFFSKILEYKEAKDDVRKAWRAVSGRTCA